jgi:hypothetical protein
MGSRQFHIFCRQSSIDESLDYFREKHFVSEIEAIEMLKRIEWLKADIHFHETCIRILSFRLD